MTWPLDVDVLYQFNMLIYFQHYHFTILQLSSIFNIMPLTTEQKDEIVNAMVGTFHEPSDIMDRFSATEEEIEEALEENRIEACSTCGVWNTDVDQNGKCESCAEDDD